MTEEARLILNELGKINERLDRMDERLDRMDERLDRMDERLDRMDERFDQIEAHLSSSDRKISEIQMTLENEVNKKISIVAEGHCDLVRKLDEALRIEK
ncbi:MAG: hemolysin XhlA family protein [Lachnospiraceae bacterium]|nr:hemolysin XhlA family protein [Lachnospiraceae bacterium]